MRSKRGLLFVTMLVLLLGLLPQLALAEQTDWPKDEDICVYPFNINPSPSNSVIGMFPVESGRAPYIIFRNLPEGAVVRIYDSPNSNASLLGKGRADSLTVATVGINQGLNQANISGYVYYTIQQGDKTESTKRPIPLGKTISPRIEFDYRYVGTSNEEAYTLPIEESTSYIQIQTRDSIAPGDVLAVNVNLKDIPYMTAITLPLRYDTDMLELLAKKPSSSGYWNNISEQAFTTETGEYVPPSTETLAETVGDLGVVVGNAMYYKNNIPKSAEEQKNMWLATVRMVNNEQGKMPYVNMETGYISFGADVTEGVKGQAPAGCGDVDAAGVSPVDMTGSNQTLLRLFFRYKGTKTLNKTAFLKASTLKYGDEVIKTGLAPVRVATKEECPTEYLDTPMANKYYNTLYPEGVVPQVGLVNLFTPNPPALLEVEQDWADMDSVPAQEGTLSVGEVINEYAKETLPIDHVKVYNFTNEGYSIAAKADSTATLEDLAIGSLATYNYTNSNPYNASPYRPLDNIRDYIKIQFTSDLGSETSHSGIKVGDIVKIYKDNVSLTPVATKAIEKMGAYDMEIDLGSNILDAEGGYLYIAIERGDSPGVEGQRVEIEYDKEYQRDVYFEISRESYHGEKIDKETAPIGFEAALNKPNTLGEKFQLKIYFNDFRDLRGYMLPLAFNAESVKVADMEFNPVADGGITQQQIQTGTRGIRIGKDFADCSVGELEIWNAVTQIKNDYVEEQIDAQLTELLASCTWKEEFPNEVQTIDDLKRIYEEVETKLGIGVPGEEKAWYGGLLFGEAESSSVEQVPYIINNPVSGENGLIDIWAMSLQAAGPLTDRYVTVETADGEEQEILDPYHVLTINFVGQGVISANANPDFHIAENSGGSGDANYSIGSPNGFAPVIMGEQIDMNDTTRTVTPGYTEHWSIQPYEEEQDYQIVLHNRPEADDIETPGVNGEKTNLYTYFRQPFRDPGFEIKALKEDVPEIADQEEAVKNVVRELVIDTQLNDGTKLQIGAIPLATYSENEIVQTLSEALASAGVQGHKISKLEVAIKYSYTPETIEPADPIQATRKVFVIHQRGDINRDGEIDNTDYVALMDHVTRKKPIVAFDNFVDSLGGQTNQFYDENYATTVGDTDLDGKVHASDTALLKLHTQYGIKIRQDYEIPKVAEATD